MLNKRHKAILFVTVTMTGCALLAGLDLNRALASISTVLEMTNAPVDLA
jgi:hypothetical protein